MASKVPLEKVESKALADRLDLHWYLFSAIRNESDSRSFYKWKQRKESWVRSGCPDFLLKLCRWSICMIELKRQKPILKNWTLWVSPSKVSPEQLIWQEEISEMDNCFAKICYWAKEAIEFIIECEAS